MRALVGPVLLVTAALSLSAQALQSDNRLFVRPWVELEPLVRVDTVGEDGSTRVRVPPEGGTRSASTPYESTRSAATPYPVPRTDAERALLEEARVLLSGMVYGWLFDYVPANKTRAVAESFTLTPTAQIPWGSPRLRIVETETRDERLWARASYSMDDAESARRASWESSIADLSQGEGKASVMKGPDAKTLSFRDAIRDAIRMDLHGRYLDAPRQIRGDVLLWEDPTTFVRSGMYWTDAKVKIVVREVIPYRIF